MRIEDLGKCEKPQGFTVGKIRLKGWYSCPFDCGELFLSKKEARRHHGCEKELQCEARIREMHAAYGDILKPLSFDRCRTSKENEKSSDEEILRSLPVISETAKVRSYIEDLKRFSRKVPKSQTVDDA